MGAGQERRGRASVVAGAVAVGSRCVEAESAKHEQVFAVWREGLEQVGELEASAFGCRGPVGHVLAVGDKEKEQAGGVGAVLGGRGRCHGVEERQRHGRAGTAEKRSSWNLPAFAHRFFPCR